MANAPASARAVLYQAVNLENLTELMDNDGKEEKTDIVVPGHRAALENNLYQAGLQRR